MLIYMIIAACVAAAMLSSIIRPQRPELASALTLAVSVAVIAALVGRVGDFAPRLEKLTGWIAGSDAASLNVILKCAGIAIVGELGVQICDDAGESALGGRIMLASRVAIAALCLPLLSEIASLASGVFG